MRRAMRVLALIALPGLIFGALVGSLASEESGPSCGSGDGGLLSLIGSRPCPSGDYHVLLVIGLIVMVAVTAAGVLRARPESRS